MLTQFDEYIRANASVVNIRFLDGKWQVQVVMQSKTLTGSGDNLEAVIQSVMIGAN